MSGGTAQRGAPPHWRRRMGTAFVFLVLLDIIILVGVFGGGRLSVAVLVTVVVLALIAIIWIRNSKLEKATADAAKKKKNDGSKPVRSAYYQAGAEPPEPNWPTSCETRSP